MKNLLCAALLLLLSTSIYAQHFSIGARTGVGKWSGMEYGDAENGRILWEKEVFGRMAVGKHFAFELGGFRQDGKPYSYYEDYIDTHRTATITSREWKNTFYGLNLRVQYHLGHARIKGLHNYIGIVLSPVKMMEHGSYTEYVTATRETTTLGNDFSAYGWQLGLEDMIQYRLSNNLAFHLLLSYRNGIVYQNDLSAAWSTPGGFLGPGCQAQIGAAYTFSKKENMKKRETGERRESLQKTELFLPGPASAPAGVYCINTSLFLAHATAAGKCFILGDTLSIYENICLRVHKFLGNEKPALHCATLRP